MKTSSFIGYLKITGVMLTLGSFLFVLSNCSSSDDDKPGLVISGISPSSGPKATVVSITGSGFNPNAVDNVVTLNTITCAVTSASSNELKITIPPKGGSGKLIVTVNGKTGETPLFTYVNSPDESAPVISSISPLAGPRNTVVTITGIGFNANAVDNHVTLNDKNCIVTSASATELKVIIPPKGGSGKLIVTVNGKIGETPLFTYVSSPDESAPVISSISPLAGPINTVVTITGIGFNANAVDNHVTLNDKNCTITSASATELKVIVPSKAGSGRIKVKVNDLTGETPEFTYVYSQFTKTVFAGSTRGELEVPMGVAVDGDGNVYVAEAQGNKITKITPSGALSTLADNISGQFTDPYGIALDSKGNVYVSDYGDNKIKKITPLGAVTVFAGNTAGEFNSLRGIAIDRDDNVYIADFGNNKVKKITPSGMVSLFADFTSPMAITVDGDGNVYVAGPYQIKKITDGVVSPFAGSTKGDDDMFDEIAGIAVDKNGTVYASDNHNFKIKKITSLRSVSSIANMSHPQGIAIDKNGDLYIAISFDSVIVKIVQE